MKFNSFHSGNHNHRNNARGVLVEEGGLLEVCRGNYTNTLTGDNS